MLKLDAPHTQAELSEAITMHADLQDFKAYTKLVGMFAEGGAMTNEVIVSTCRLVKALQKAGLSVS